MAQVQTRDLTYEEFVRLHEVAQDQGLGLGYELDDGELILMVALDPSQGRAQLEFGRQLANHVAETSLGEVFLDSFMPLGPRQWLYPDLAYLTHEDLERFDGRRLPVPPTLLVEMCIESSVKRDTVQKKLLYHDARVPWYWIVNLVSEEIEEYRWAPDAYELVSRTGLYEAFAPALFPGLTIQLTRLIPRAKTTDAN